MRRKLFNFLTSAAIVISLLSLTSCKYNKVTQYEDTDDIMYTIQNTFIQNRFHGSVITKNCLKSDGLGISRH